jgi:hypothetical protein
MKSGNPKQADKPAADPERKPDFKVVRVSVKTGIKVGKGPETTPT